MSTPQTKDQAELQFRNKVSDLVRNACIDAVNDVNAGYSFHHGGYVDEIMAAFTQELEKQKLEAELKGHVHASMAILKSFKLLNSIDSPTPKIPDYAIEQVVAHGDNSIAQLKEISNE